MKNLTTLTACLLALGCTPLLAQAPARPTPGEVPTRVPAATRPAPNSDELTRFDLNFPGGTPKELVAAIQKALGRSLNAIVPEEFATVKLPALRMEHVNVSQLFDALGAAGRKSEAMQTGRSGSYQITSTGYGFRQGSQDRLSDDTIWYFYVEKPVTLPAAPAAPAASPAKVCRFYSLAPYLERKFTVDDITTAIETGWKLLGDTAPPTISFHKDTRLLIAVGEPEKLETIDAALAALAAPKDPAAPDPLVTKIIQLKYASPSNIVQNIQVALMDKRSRVMGDTRTSQLVVLATEKEMIGVEQLVQHLDTQTKQVLIEARQPDIQPTSGAKP